jgi:hypothetical protein
MAKTPVQIIFIVFLVISFFVGAYVYATIDIRKMVSKIEGMDTIESSNQDPPQDTEDCPDFLIRRGKLLYLFNSKKEEDAGSNPRIFNNLDEYIHYLEDQKSNGKVCPVLFLQQETTAQGEDVYRIRPSPWNQQPGLPITSSLLLPPDNRKVKALDASRENGYNQNMYAGFDPYGQYVGKFTDVDQIHVSTEKANVSDNPMDINWGGVLYTQGKIDEGKYKLNEVTPTNYTTPTGGEVIPIPNANLPPYPSQEHQMQAPISERR